MNARRWGVARIVSMAIALVVCAEAVAEPLFSTFELLDDYSTLGGWAIGWPDGNFDQGDRFSFPGTQSYSLASVELALALQEGANAVDVWLMTDAGGQPGTILESFSFIGVMKPFDGMLVPPLVGYSTSHPILEPDTYYWLIASAPDDTATSAAWYFNSADMVGAHATRQLDGPWCLVDDTLGAFRINGTPYAVHAPLPGAALLVAIGIGTAGSALRRRRML